MASRITKGHLLELESQELVTTKCWWLWKEGDLDPLPRGYEPVLLVTHIKRGLPPYSVEQVRSAPSLTVSKEQRMDVDILVIVLVALVRKGVSGMDLLEIFFRRRI
ncbi:hypothetical protein D1007_31033 [Hordeum vulgare]|nr:hypothetical protein D1007_31033 [Hordeum vulgare]